MYQTLINSRTTKEGKRNHGLGIGNRERALRKYSISQCVFALQDIAVEWGVIRVLRMQ